MPKYKVSFEYETEVEADNEEDAIFNCSTVICEYMGDNAIVEEIEEGKTWVTEEELRQLCLKETEQFVKEPTNKKGVSDE